MSSDHPIIHDEFVIGNKLYRKEKDPPTNSNSLKNTLSDGIDTQKMSPRNAELDPMKNTPWNAQFSEISEISGQEEMIDELKRF